MKPNTDPRPENAPRRIVLRGGIDFIYTDELHQALTNELERAGINKGGVLLCGYDETAQTNGRSRTHTFAMTVEETEARLEHGQDWCPYQYAEAAIGNGGKGVVAVYDENCFTGDGIWKYRLNAGLTIEDATILVVELV